MMGHVGIVAALAGATVLAACHSGSGKEAPLIKAGDNYVASVRAELGTLPDIDKYSDDQIGGFGLRACDDLDAGKSVAETRSDLIAQGAPTWMAPTAVGAAMVNFCPSYVAP
jgi:hypothetical protein